MLEPNSPEEYDELYSAKPGKWVNPKRDAFAFNHVSEYLKDPPYSLLDLGCGNGHTLEMFHSMWPHVHYYGIDLSPVAIKLARSKVPGAKLYASRLDAFDPMEVVDRFGPFNVILIMGVAEHFRDITEELDEVRRRLAKDGIVYLEVPNNMVIEEKEEEGWFASKYQTEWFLKRDSWEKIIQSVGFEIVKKIYGPYLDYEFIWILKDGKDR